MQLYDALRDAGFSEEHALRVAKAVVVCIENLARQHEERFVKSSSMAASHPPAGLHGESAAKADPVQHIASTNRQLIAWLVCCNVALALVVFIIARTVS
jgi:hypothetical protein